MTCRAIMTIDPVTLRSDDSVATAAERMAANRFIILPVVDAEGRYHGLFGVFELLRLLLPSGATLDDLVPNLRFMADNLPGLQQLFGKMSSQPIGALTRTDLPVLRPEMAVVEALLLFFRHRSTLPVVDEKTGKLLGVLSYWDAVSAITQIAPRQGH